MRLELDRLRTPSQQRSACERLAHIRSSLSEADRSAFSGLVGPALRTQAEALPGPCLLLWAQTGAQRDWFESAARKAARGGDAERLVACLLVLARAHRRRGLLAAAYAVAWLTGAFLEKVDGLVATSRSWPMGCEDDTPRRWLWPFARAIGLDEPAMLQEVVPLAKNRCCGTTGAPNPARGR